MDTAVTVESWSFDRVRASPLRECTVCLEMKHETDYPSAALTDACLHDPSTCLDCVRYCIRTDLNNKLWSDTACPECESRLTPDAIQRYADDESWLKYNELSLRSSLEKDETFVWVCLLHVSFRKC